MYGRNTYIYTQSLPVNRFHKLPNMPGHALINLIYDPYLETFIGPSLISKSILSKERKRKRFETAPL